MTALEKALAWKIRGHAHEAAGEIEEALACYARGLELVEALAPDDPPVRRARGVLRMNRGHALQRLGPARLAEAAEAYAQAVALLSGLPDEPEHRNALGSALMNRGRALQEWGGQARLDEAVRCHEEAIAVLSGLPRGADPYFAVNLAGAWIGLACAQMALGREKAAAAAAQASDAVDDALAAVRRANRADAHLRSLAARLFRFGARYYAIRQPQFLPEFLRENLDPGAPFAADEAFRSSAAEAVRLARESLARPRLLFAGDPASEALLGLSRELADRPLLSSSPERPAWRPGAPAGA